ncbi:regulatory protein RecX [Brevibacterium yomogidense]|uniref:regulatory protein RecX n=1 Tax=Brevibacterium yomogidense TaxID=946573 RepID=UPI0018E033ED
MAETDDRQSLLSSLQQAIDAVPEVPPAQGGADLAGESRPGTGCAAVGQAAAGSASEGEDDADAEAIRDASKRAYAILALRDHSRVEMRQKLVGRGHEERIVDVLLGKLEHAGLLDDVRFAEQFVRSQRTGKGRSLSAISRALREKGVSDEDARDALADVGDDFPFALDAARKKAASTRGLPHDMRLRRTLGVLGRRGFSGSVARRAAAQALDDDGDASLT